MSRAAVDDPNARSELQRLRRELVELKNQVSILTNQGRILSLQARQQATAPTDGSLFWVDTSGASEVLNVLLTGSTKGSRYWPIGHSR